MFSSTMSWITSLFTYSVFTSSIFTSSVESNQSNAVELGLVSQTPHVKGSRDGIPTWARISFLKKEKYEAPPPTICTIPAWALEEIKGTVV